MSRSANRVAVLCFLLTLITASPLVEASQKQATIYFIRGGPIDFGTYPTSDTILGEFLREGKRQHYSSLIARQGWWPAAANICAEIVASKKRGKLVLVGHSFGATGAVRVAQCLDKHHLRVDLLATIDIIPNPAMLLDPYRLPNNVLQSWNYYQQQDPSLIWGHPSARRNGDADGIHNFRVHLPYGFAGHTRVDDAACPEIVKRIQTLLRDD